MLRRLFWLLTIGAALAACGEQPDEPALPFDFYVLALSWSPSYCAAEGERANAQQCDGDRDLGFVVHGLWPQFANGWPEFCDDDAPNPSRAEIRSINDIMPSNGLIRHQWRKHGTCTGLPIDVYFDTTRAAFEKVALPELADGRVSTASLHDSLLEVNPGLPQDGLSITCPDGLLRDIRICLTVDLAFRSCPEVAQRSCGRFDVRIPPR